MEEERRALENDRLRAKLAEQEKKQAAEVQRLAFEQEKRRMEEERSALENDRLRAKLAEQEKKQAAEAQRLAAEHEKRRMEEARRTPIRSVPETIDMSTENMTDLPVKACGFPTTESLWNAAKDGDAKQVIHLLRAGADINATVRGAGATALLHSPPLLAASFKGHSKVVKLLLDAGADVDKPNKVGDTPLYWASCKGFAEVVQLLLAAGADTGRYRRESVSPLCIASERGHVEVVRLLLDAGATIVEHTTLICAAKNGHVEVVQLLLDAGADIDASNGFGTALHWAVLGGHEEVVRLLLNSGADRSLDNIQYRTPLDDAIKNGNTQIIKLLKSTNVRVRK